jgi:hypothetical protein
MCLIFALYTLCAMHCAPFRFVISLGYVNCATRFDLWAEHAVATRCGGTQGLLYAVPYAVLHCRYTCWRLIRMFTASIQIAVPSCNLVAVNTLMHFFCIIVLHQDELWWH